VCLVVAEGAACLGPVTRAGCGALCPSVGRGCFGCFGPADTTNTVSLAAHLVEAGAAPVDVSRLFATFNANAPAFAEEAAAQGGPVSQPLADPGGHEEGR
jgi:coenzyme F420-reducing hydrogenase gamma subunit